MFNKDICRQINKELAEAAAIIAAKHGLKVNGKGGTFDSAVFIAKMEFFHEDKKQDTEKQTFQRMAPLYGLSPDWFGVEVAIYGDRYRIVGLKPKSPKYPILIERGGKKYKASAADIIRAMT